MKRHPGRGLLVVALLMLSGVAIADTGLTVDDKVTLVAAGAAGAISDEDDCTQSTAARTTAAASGRCTRG